MTRELQDSIESRMKLPVVPAAELRALLGNAGLRGSVHRRRGFRLVAVCEARHAHG